MRCSQWYPFLLCPLGDNVLEILEFFLSYPLYEEFGLFDFRRVVGQAGIANQLEWHVLDLELNREVQRVFAIGHCIEELMLLDAAVGADLQHRESISKEVDETEGGETGTNKIVDEGECDGACGHALDMKNVEERWRLKMHGKEGYNNQNPTVSSPSTRQPIARFRQCPGGRDV